MYVFNNSKLMRETGWTPRRSLVETFGAILTFWEHNRELLMQQRTSGAGANVPLRDAELVSQGGVEIRAHQSLPEGNASAAWLKTYRELVT